MTIKYGGDPTRRHLLVVSSPGFLDGRDDSRRLIDRVMMMGPARELPDTVWGIGDRPTTHAVRSRVNYRLGGVQLDGSHLTHCTVPSCDCSDDAHRSPAHGYSLGAVIIGFLNRTPAPSSRALLFGFTDDPLMGMYSRMLDAAGIRCVPWYRTR